MFKIKERMKSLTKLSMQNIGDSSQDYYNNYYYTNKNNVYLLESIVTYPDPE